MGQTGPLLYIFVLFSRCKDKYSTNLTLNDKSIDGVLESQTWGGRTESADESTELWRHPAHRCYLFFGGKLRGNDKFSAIPAINLVHNQ